MLSILKLVVTALCVLLGLCSARPSRNEQSSIQYFIDNVDLGPENITTAGFDLSTSYAAVAIALANGTTIPIARVDVNEEYRTLMKEMSRVPHLDLPWLRFPEETEVFTPVLAQLLKVVEDFLGYKIKAGLVAMPNLNGEHSEYIAQALRDIGLVDLNNHFGLKHTSAVFAASGFGLCKEYLNRTACLAEEDHMSQRYIISILFTSNSLCLEDSRQYTAYGHWGLTSADFTLGYSIHDFNPDSRYYWEAVRRRILATASNMYDDYDGTIDPPAQIFLFGDEDAASDPRMRQTIDEVMEMVFGERIPVYADDPVFAAAKGAAELAKRGNYPLRHWDDEDEMQVHSDSCIDL